jgi:hypothetical protein
MPQRGLSHFRARIRLIPLKLFPSCLQAEYSQIRLRASNQPRQFIPPKLFSNISSTNENRCRNIMLFQYWLGKVEIIGIPIIKRNSD